MDLLLGCSHSQGPTRPKMSTSRPLTPEQYRGAQLLGEGWKHLDVAEELGTTTKSIQRWLKKPDFQALVDKAHRRKLDDNPTPASVLTGALSATKRDGSPDWQMRVTAARALLGKVPEAIDPEERVRETRVYIGEDA
jgi:hypothetical protein